MRFRLEDVDRIAEMWKRNPTRVTDSQIFQFAYIYNGSIGSDRCVVSLSFLYSVLRRNTSSVFYLNVHRTFQSSHPRILLPKVVPRHFKLTSRCDETSDLPNLLRHRIRIRIASSHRLIGLENDFLLYSATRSPVQPARIAGRQA
jgi:hypothetical protein